MNPQSEHSDVARAAAQYMVENRWLKDGVAWEQVASLIDRERQEWERKWLVDEYREATIPTKDFSKCTQVILPPVFL